MLDRARLARSILLVSIRPAAGWGTTIDAAWQVVDGLTMRLWFATALVLASLALPAVGSAAPVAHEACSRDTPATIGGQHKCLGAGEYCATRYERQYERYGFICSTHYDPPRLRRT
ncbi:MAG TPA: hypothetical protein VK761_08265 [Solirubrobacteraceae bacterium]|nr:hypothetical protein [Solirubrobacteraceae bacterium]